MGNKAKILIYSHDSFGLGHIRRCRTIAHALAEAYRGLEVLIVSGSPIIGSFDFKARVDFVRVPGLIKLRNGEYESLSRHRPVAETTKLRAAMIGETAVNYAPDIVIVDKEPLGLRGELEGTLARLKRQGARLILGLRDVLDAPDVLAEEWTRKRAFGALDRLYDEIWIFGLNAFYDPLQGLNLPPHVIAKTHFTGYLRRTLPAPATLDDEWTHDHPNYIVVTPGGGGDGGPMVDSVLGAYETGAHDLPPALVVLGPFMPVVERIALKKRSEAIPNVDVITFDSRIERRVAGASGVVAMGGYNTFCEILSFDRPAILMPRTRPRREQEIRALRAKELGLCSVVPMPPDGPADTRAVAAAIAALPTQAPPSHATIPGLLDGLQHVITRTGALLGQAASG